MSIESRIEKLEETLLISEEEKFPPILIRLRDTKRIVMAIIPGTVKPNRQGAELHRLPDESEQDFINRVNNTKL